MPPFWSYAVFQPSGGGSGGVAYVSFSEPPRVRVAIPGGGGGGAGGGIGGGGGGGSPEPLYENLEVVVVGGGSSCSLRSRSR